MFFSRIFTVLCLCITTSFSCLASPLSQGGALTERTIIDDKVVLGRTENVYFPGIEEIAGIGIPAKIDTGADSTSIHAENIKITATDPIFADLSGDELLKAIADEFDALTSTKLRDREDKTDIMVSFDLIHPYSGETVAMTLPLFRLALIKSRGEGHLHRPVVELDLQIANQTVRTEVNLTDRSRFSYPILVGKTFLRNTAWVDAGYDFLQQQSDAQIIGRREQALVAQVPVDVSLSFTNRYSSLHALDILVDEQGKQVNFTLEGSNGQRQKMTLPLVRMLKFKDSQRPLVYIPIQLGVTNQSDEEKTDNEHDKQMFDEHVLVYLRDRSKNSTQLRLGTEALNQHFTVDLSQSELSNKPLQVLSDRPNDETSIMMSSDEQFILDGAAIATTPSTNIKTPLLKVTSISETKTDDGRFVQYTVNDIEGNAHVFNKRIKRKIRVGDVVRPIVESNITLPSSKLIKEVALEELKEKDGEQAIFVVGPNFVYGSLLVNTRTSNLSNKSLPVKAGYIEQANVEGMSFPVKLDTGADVSSINAHDIEYFSKNGQKWVNFVYTNSDGVEQAFSRQVIDEMKIKARPGEPSNVRPVVEMEVKLGDIDKLVAVNLRDRSRFHYSMILGQNFLKNDIVVSSDQTFILTGN
ncbi:RimK/LysX family protein [Photobacterium sp. SDRW27]|uniref:ATP-dependent zinc protease family protein n=1 Tax=Photobacterium obscurum TaxID=2829490 RepID=UPI00224475AC|nr:RimK/LysX family protein [Photobacterium obscurum]MCW8328421.1 RimK/LysX family protein [Photobacterium obscurum]